jgi:hypothetical protein
MPNVPGRSRRALIAAVVLVVAAPAGLRAQGQAPPAPLPTETPQIRFNSGQNVVPYFEGWIRNPDGTFDLVFGYFNRNWQEEMFIAAGPDNKIEPGAVDRGQPTYFLARRRRFVFRVKVPADFGKKEIVWTINAHGKTEKAYGTLLPSAEISERVVQTNGGYNPGHDDPNTPPSVSIEPAGPATVGSSLTLTALVADDGLPKPRPAAPAAPRPAASANPFGAQVNSSGPARPRGLTVSWLQYSGPAKVIFDRSGPIPVADGKAVAVAQFTAPGKYVLVATANDGALSKQTEVTITVPPLQ